MARVNISFAEYRAALNITDEALTELESNNQAELMEGCDYQNDLITMLTVVTFDRFGVIRDYLYDRDENGEYFFGISKGNKIEVYLLISAEDL